MSVGFLKKRARGRKYRKTMTESEKSNSEEVFQEVKRIVLNEKINAYRDKDKSVLGLSVSNAARRLRYELSLITSEIPNLSLDIDAMNEAEMLDINRWIQFVSGRKQDTTDCVRTLLSFISPDQIMDRKIYNDEDCTLRFCPELDYLIPDDPDVPYDMRAVITAIVDKGLIFKAPASCTASMIICFARIGGKPVGIIANQPFFPFSLIDSGIADRAAKFIRFCDTFNIPIVLITEAPGILSGYGSEWSENIRHGAKLLWSYSAASVPKILIITRKTWEAESMPFSSRHLGADVVFEWTDGNREPVSNLHDAEIMAEERTATPTKAPRRHKQKIQSLEFLFSASKKERSGFSEVRIRPSETRVEIASAISSLNASKAQEKDKKTVWESGWAKLDKSISAGLPSFADTARVEGYSSAFK